MADWGLGRSNDLAKAVVFRAISVILVLLLVATVCFVLFRVDGIDGWPMFPYYRHEDPYLRGESLLTQYFSYLEHTFSGDFYVSKSSGDVEVSSFIYTYAARSTVVICLAAMTSIAVGLAWGWISERRSGAVIGKSLHLCALLFLSVPALLLVYLSFKVDEILDLGLLPGGMILGTDLAGTVEVAILPFLALAVSGSGFFALVTLVGLRRARRLGVTVGPVRALDYVAPLQYFLVPFMVTEMMLIEPTFPYRGLVFLVMNGIISGDGPVLMAGFFVLSAIVLIVQVVFRMVIAAIVYTRSGKIPVTKEAGSVAQQPPAEEGWQRPRLSLSMVVEASRGISKDYLRSRVGAAALIVFAFIVLAGVFAGTITGVDDPVFSSSSDLLAAPSIDHLLGTDMLGRDVLAMNLYAARFDVSLVAGVGILSTLVGLFVGFLASFTARWSGLILKVSKGILSVLSDTSLAIPVGIILVFLLIYSAKIDTFISTSLFFVFFVWCWAWWLVARPVRGACSRAYAVEGGLSVQSLADSLGRFRGSFFLILANTTFVTKLIVPVALIVSTAIIAFGAWPAPELLGNALSWEALLYDGYLVSGFVTTWWLVYPPILELMVLSLVCYVGLNSLEHVFERRSRLAASGDYSLRTVATSTVDAAVEHAHPEL